MKKAIPGSEEARRVELGRKDISVSWKSEAEGRDDNEENIFQYYYYYY